MPFISTDDVTIIIIISNISKWINYIITILLKIYIPYKPFKIKTE